MNKKGYKTNLSSSIISLKKTIILLVITSSLLLGYVWTRLKAIELTYRYSILSTRERALMERNYKLRLEASSLKSPMHLTNLAFKKLNFIKTQRENKIFIALKDEK